MLVIYATVEGQTARIVERIVERLNGAGHRVTAVRAREEEPLPEVAPFDAVIVGASVHYGHHPAYFARALHRQKDALQGKPSAFFSVSLSADGPGANRPAAARYMRKFLAKIGWQPRAAVAFGGALRYSEYVWWKRELVRLFVRVAGGDTDISRDYEYTDWAAVAQFADAFSRDAT